MMRVLNETPWLLPSFDITEMGRLPNKALPIEERKAQLSYSHRQKI